MTNETSNLPMKDEASNIGDEAERDAGFQKMLKFKKGIYICDGEEIDLGTKLIAHCIGWTKCWIKFVDQKVAERKVYRVAKGERAPERDQLSDNDESKWPIGINKLPADPWVYQYLLPMEDMASGEVRIFVGSSFGGRRAVADLCAAYARRCAKNKNSGQPIVTLRVLMMPTKNYGDVPRPHFEIISWDDAENALGGGTPREPIRQLDMSEAMLKKQEFDDDLPF
jgi:hypothetical protein